MMKPEKLRIARQLIGVVLQLTDRQGDQEFITKLSVAVAKIMSVEAEEIHTSAKFDFLIQQSTVTNQRIDNIQNLIAILVGMANADRVEIPDELLQKVGLKRASNLVIAR